MRSNGNHLARGVVSVTAAVAVLLIGSCSAAEQTSKPAPTGAPTTGTPSASPSIDPYAALRRPWAHPRVAAGAACPVTTELSRPDPGLAPLLGTAPARPAGLDAGAVLNYGAPDQRTVWVDRTWGGQKVLWAVNPTVTGPVLIRGRQLDGPGELAFEDPALPELVLNTGTYEGQPGVVWRAYPSYTRVRVPGCYAYQIDTAAGTWTVVFIARGPRV
jgi:hypothetical protein